LFKAVEDDILEVYADGLVSRWCWTL